MSALIVVTVLLLFAVAGIMAYVVMTYNIFIQLSHNIEKAWSNIEVILKQRHDELPKLVEVCNSYMGHERETLEAVTKARALYDKSATVDEKARAENQLTNVLRTLFAVAEQYPDLKANQEFLHVQERISALESTIADRREFYNDSVNLYNIQIAQIPAVLVAQQSGFRSRRLLKVPPADRQDVSLDFANRATCTESTARRGPLTVTAPLGAPPRPVSNSPHTVARAEASRSLSLPRPTRDSFRRTHEAASRRPPVPHRAGPCGAPRGRDPGRICGSSS